MCPPSRSLFETISEDTVLMERLLGYGAEPRQTALHVAAKMGHRDTVIVSVLASSLSAGGSISVFCSAEV